MWLVTLHSADAACRRLICAMHTTSRHHSVCAACFSSKQANAIPRTTKSPAGVLAAPPCLHNSCHGCCRPPASRATATARSMPAAGQRLQRAHSLPPSHELLLIAATPLQRGCPAALVTGHVGRPLAGPGPASTCTPGDASACRLRPCAQLPPLQLRMLCARCTRASAAPQCTHMCSAHAWLHTCSRTVHCQSVTSSTTNSSSRPSLYTRCSRSMFGNVPGLLRASATSSRSNMHSAVMALRRLRRRLYWSSL